MSDSFLCPLCNGSGYMTIRTCEADEWHSDFCLCAIGQTMKEFVQAIKDK